MYSTIYADPPWEQKNGRPLGKYNVVDGKQIFSNAITNNARPMPYNTMTVEEIASLPVKDISNKDAHLYLWCTNKYLLQATCVIEAWGFKYSTTLVWAKNIMGGGLGGTFKVNTEFLLFCTRGKVPAKKSVSGTWYNKKRPYVNGYPASSKKPDFFKELIESVSPSPYLEMFAREQKTGWDVFGNEVENSIILK